jgi:hypothetical protein
VALVAAVREKLDAAFAARRQGERPLLVVGVTPGAHLDGYDFPALARQVDWLVQFGYDLRNPALGPWVNTAPLWPDGATRPIEAPCAASRRSSSGAAHPARSSSSRCRSTRPTGGHGWTCASA